MKNIDIKHISLRQEFTVSDAIPIRHAHTEVMFDYTGYQGESWPGKDYPGGIVFGEKYPVGINVQHAVYKPWVGIGAAREEWPTFEYVILSLVLCGY